MCTKVLCVSCKTAWATGLQHQNLKPIKIRTYFSILAKLQSFKIRTNICYHTVTSIRVKTFLYLPLQPYHRACQLQDQAISGQTAKHTLTHQQKAGLKMYEHGLPTRERPSISHSTSHQEACPNFLSSFIRVQTEEARTTIPQPPK